jgi:hypothetical protein
MSQEWLTNNKRIELLYVLTKERETKQEEEKEGNNEKKSDSTKQ